ncbi:MAG: hypothetical protein R3F55_18605 [Alphaproteobacteria bacterium]
MPSGPALLGLGAAVIAIGVALVGGFVTFAGDSAGSVGYGALGVGSVLALVGMIAMPRRRETAVDSAEAFQSDISRQALLAALAYAAASDGHLHEAEAETVQHVFQKLTGKPIDMAAIKASVVNVDLHREPIRHHLAGLWQQIDRDVRIVILHGAYLVACADDEMHAMERPVLADIASGLMLTENERRSAYLMPDVAEPTLAPAIHG